MKATSYLLASAFFFAAISFTAFSFAQSQDIETLKKSSTYPGQVSDWNGFELHDFQFAGRNAKLVFPKEAAKGNPWIWRARFFGHEPQFDVASLKKGYAVAYIDSAPLLGSPRSVALWQDFYTYLTQEFQLSRTTNLEGMSRGGLYTTNWAFAYPDEVASIYIDNPVLDFRSWPGGFGHGMRSDSDWGDVLKSYGLTEEEALAYDKCPKDNEEGCRKLAERGVGILLVCGDSDKCVPGDENWVPFKKLYESIGGQIELILKPGMDHHPHSLPDPTPIIDFVAKFDKTGK